MAKYLCKVTLRTDSGEIQYKSGKTYKAGRRCDSDALDIVADDGISRLIAKDDIDGWFDAFELVKVKWPEPLVFANGVYGSGATITGDTGEYGYVRFSGNNGEHLGMSRGAVVDLVVWLNLWLEAAESNGSK